MQPALRRLRKEGAGSGGHHPTVKLLALSFLSLIAMTLIAVDGGTHVLKRIFLRNDRILAHD
jgi:hypothetical protein